jgi:predicted acylesterase/phospholipase RssA
MATPSSGRGRRFTALAPVLTVALATALGCSGQPWVNPPEELLGRPWQNVPQPTPDTYPDPLQTTTAGLDAAFGHNPNPTPAPAQPETRPLNVLAISAGGKYAASAAGVLNGWTAAGTRPQFDVVTGVSGGALLAVYAFLGPQYDARAEELFVNISRRDLFRIRPVTGLIHRNAVASTEPFAELIEHEVNDAVVAELAREHCAGRRLFVATGNRTSLRLAIWDLGAVAASGRPDAAALVRKILLAAASHPGFAPAVEFDVTLNGVHYRELHGDGGNLTQAFVRTANGLAPGSNVYVVSAGKYYRDPQEERPRAFSTVTTAASNTLYTLFRVDTQAIYALCAVSRSRFHVVATPPEVKVTAGSLSFDQGDQRKLFDAGYRQGLTGTDWRNTPPGSQPWEVLVPRTGLDFVTGATVVETGR